MNTTIDQAGLTFSRSLHVSTVRTAGKASSDADLLAKARARALDPTVFDRYAPFFWQGEISSQRWDAYDTRMAPSTLKNFADDAEQGIAFLRNHLTSEDPVGASVSGSFVGGQGNGVARTLADFYALSDPETAPYIAKLQAGVVRDLSVGFHSGEWICTICHRDMMDWMSADGCMHLLGVSYTPRDATGHPSGDPQVARATIENAHLAEVSGVYDGATPGAMIGKARSLAQDGQLTERGRGLVEQRYHIHLPAAVRTFAGVDLTAPRAPQAAADVQQPSAETDDARELRELRVLRAQAIEEALQAGSVALGPAFALYTHRSLLETAPIRDILALRDRWRATEPSWKAARVPSRAYQA